MGWATELNTIVDEALIEIFNLVYGKVMLGGNLETELALSFGETVKNGDGLSVECYIEYKVYNLLSNDSKVCLLSIPCSTEKTMIYTREDLTAVELELTMILDMRVGDLKLAFAESLELLSDRERVLIEEHHVIRDAEIVTI
ncbi:hypothetical protein ABC382_00550 [Lysinibacillus sp. 1P01SD]|uniref:hypothetical protein n=1 Tax=Lysinibacillus sp. 1P01SD TaxID=3132285 RepID=UPI0039A01265